MNKRLNLIGILFLVGSIGIASAQVHIGQWVDVIKPCQTMCFDLKKNPSTLGFDPKFLNQELVKNSCQNALTDGEKLPYCDVKLGTL